MSDQSSLLSIAALFDSTVSSSSPTSLPTSLPTSQLSDVPIYDIYIANRASATLCLAVKLGVIDEVERRGCCHLSDIRHKYALSLRGASAFCLALVALKLFRISDLSSLSSLSSSLSVEDDNPSFCLTPMASEFLVSSKPCYLGGLIELEYDNFITPQSLLQCMKTGKPRAYDTEDVWKSHEQDFQQAKQFTVAMQSISVRPAIALACKFPFGKFSTMLDVGGGSGIYTIAALTLHPTLRRGIVFEIPVICDVANEFIHQYRVADRCTPHSGDMFKDAFPPADLVFYSQILHDWPPEKGKELLKKAFDLLPEGGAVAVHEKLVDNDFGGPLANSLVSVDMLFWTEGQQYTSKQLTDMMTEIGFKNPQCLSTVGYWSIVWAFK